MRNLSGLFLRNALRTRKAPQAFLGLEVDVTSLGTRAEGPCGLPDFEVPASCGIAVLEGVWVLLGL